MGFTLGRKVLVKQLLERYSEPFSMQSRPFVILTQVGNRIVKAWDDRMVATIQLLKICLSLTAKTCQVNRGKYSMTKALSSTQLCY
jgi:hypothetical protein